MAACMDPGAARVWALVGEEAAGEVGGGTKPSGPSGRRDNFGRKPSGGAVTRKLWRFRAPGTGACASPDMPEAGGGRAPGAGGGPRKEGPHTHALEGPRAPMQPQAR